MDIRGIRLEPAAGRVSNRFMKPIFTTPAGTLYQGDCLKVLPRLASESFDLVFADPPFNLGKHYPSGIDDRRSEDCYLEWCRRWLMATVRLLRPGGALMLWHLPRWGVPLAAILREHLTFRNWIAVDIKCGPPIKGRLYPAHYCLLYFIKGSAPATFHPDRLPLACCRHCGSEMKDYGGHIGKLNALGLNLSDVWSDIFPVRHHKHKWRSANALPLKLLDRIVAMATDPGSRVLDLFSGTGTACVAAELTGRGWTGIELDCSAIIDRFARPGPDRELLAHIQSQKNRLHMQKDLDRRAVAASGRPGPRAAGAAPIRCSCGAAPA